MSRSNTVGLFFRLSFVWVLMLQAKAPAQEGKWIQLFNGKDLQGWKAKIKGYDLGDNFANTFRVEEGLLKVSYDGYDKFDGRFGHLFYETPYSNYILRVEYRFVGEQLTGGPGWALRNSGLMLHGQSPESMAKDQDFPVSIEVQLLGGDGTHVRPTANVCTPGTHIEMKGVLEKQHCINSSSKTYHGDQWVTVDVAVHGSDVIQHTLEGQIVLEYLHPQLDESDPNAQRLKSGDRVLLDRGSISLQSESHPVEFRKVELMILE